MGALRREIIIAPQEGPQTLAMSTPADVAIYGGAAGGGKSWVMLAEPLRFVTDTPGFGAVIFRRTSPQITNEGSLWDEAHKMYGPLGAKPNSSGLYFEFKCKGAMNSVKFSHLEHEKNVYDWDGAQVPLIEFDELQHFTKRQFTYMLTRNRSTCGVRPYVRASCNPMPGSWILELIGWYIGEDGYPIKERSGVIRYFVNVSEVFVTAASAEELIERFPRHCSKENPPKSITFIHADLSDNKILVEKDPGYVSNLLSQPEHEQERLLRGNWKVRRAGKLFKWDWIQRCEPDQVPSLWKCKVGVDPSGGHKVTNDEQGIVTVGKGSDGKFYVMADDTCKLPPLGWGKRAVGAYRLHQAGSIVAEANFGGEMVESNILTVDANVPVELVRASRNKAVRAEPVASLYEKGLVVHVGYFPELENEMVGFDPEEAGASPNRMDALVWAIISMMENVDTAFLDYARGQAHIKLDDARQADLNKRMKELKEALAKGREAAAQRTPAQ